MPSLIYFTIASLDGYIEDTSGEFAWAAPDDEAHAFVNDLIRTVGTFLYGRRMYETMLPWETLTDGPPVLVDFARIWRGADKVVFSRTLEDVRSDRTRVERAFRPDRVRSWLDDAQKDMAIGGAELAAAAFGSQLVDEYHQLTAPHVTGGGKRALPEGMALPLELEDEQRFRGGMVYLKYRARY